MKQETKTSERAQKAVQKTIAEQLLEKYAKLGEQAEKQAMTEDHHQGCGCGCHENR